MFWMIAAIVAQKALESGMQLYGAKAQSKALKGESRQLKMAAERQQVFALIHENQRRTELSRLLAGNVADAAARGVDVSSAGFEHIQEMVERDGEFDISLNRSTELQEAAALDYAAIVKKKQARQTMVGGVLKATSTMLGAASSIGGSGALSALGSAGGAAASGAASGASSAGASSAGAAITAGTR